MQSNSNTFIVFYFRCIFYLCRFGYLRAHLYRYKNAFIELHILGIIWTYFTSIHHTIFMHTTKHFTFFPATSYIKTTPNKTTCGQRTNPIIDRLYRYVSLKLLFFCFVLYDQSYSFQMCSIQQITFSISLNVKAAVHSNSFS